MGELKINYTDEQMKAMEYVALDPQKWIQNRWDQRARQAMDEVVQDYSDKQPKKIPLDEKLRIVREAKIKTAR
ncbi:MAG: hypothetical protein JRD89_21300, partial [Deltaproteobacteria bacterium]|nr:hypothetical protein [Deltaproteobacteria bacterium]